ncbi:hypothetical protein U9M48_032143 [Paspalum notatum var. saurae]|uniref:Uncharacterized protein n=1 Tax=Paspalum notatum var. saurae TaxID=547442 RepID=A0AAQ3U4W9_PASNO
MRAYSNGAAGSCTCLRLGGSARRNGGRRAVVASLSWRGSCGWRLRHVLCVGGDEETRRAERMS